MAAVSKLFSVVEAAELLSCSKDHVYDLIAHGHLAATDIGIGRRPKTRVSAKAIDAYIAARTRTAS